MSKGQLVHTLQFCLISEPKGSIDGQEELVHVEPMSTQV